MAGRGRLKGALGKKTLEKLQMASRSVTEIKRNNRKLASEVLDELMVTAMSFAAKYQKKIIDWEAKHPNGGDPPQFLVDRFWRGMEMAGQFANHLAPYQQPKFVAHKFDLSPGPGIATEKPNPADAKLIEGKVVDISNATEVARIYSSIVRAG